MRGSAGYALPEVLAAIVISGFVAVAATGGLQHAAKLWRKTDASLLVSEDEAALVRVFESAVAQATPRWPTRSTIDDRAPQPFTGDARALGFFGVKPPWPDDPSAALYRFTITQTPAGSSVRYHRQSTPFGESIDTLWTEPNPGFEDALLYDGPIVWRFRYFGSPTETAPADWYERWDEAELPPRLIAIVPDDDLDRAVMAHPATPEYRRCADAPRVATCGPSR